MKAIKSHHLACSLLLCLVASPYSRAGTQSVDIVASKPSWTVGQTWYVEVDTLTAPPEQARPDDKKFEPKKITYGYAFAVEARKEIEGEPCYQVRVEMVSVDGRELEYSPRDYRYFYRFHFRADDCTLKMLQCTRVLDKEATLQFSNHYPRGPVNATTSTGFLPSDFPIFSLQAHKYAPRDPNKPAENGDRNMVQSQQKHQRAEGVWEVDGEEKPALNIILLSKSPGSEAGAEVAEQIWLKGMPWPVRVVYKHGKRPPLHAKLVRVDGSSIVATLRAEKQEK